jgi:hypothetical protein
MAEEQHEFLAVAGFRMSVPPDRPDLLLLEIKTAEGAITRFSITKESALIFGQQIQRAASPVAL